MKLCRRIYVIFIICISLMCSIYVYADSNSIIEVTDIDLGDYTTEMYLNDTHVIGATVIPSNATNQTVTYNSSNSSVATVNGLGRITPNSIGETIISVQAGTITKTFKLNVLEKKR